MKKNKVVWVYQILLFLSFVFIFIISIFKPLDPDEIEHIHSAWYVKNGLLPYKDFFQHHHSLMWYFLSVFLLFLKEDVFVIYFFRVLSFLVIIGELFYIYKISLLVTKSKKTSMFALILLSSTGIYLNKSVEIRPDNYMMFFMLISFYLYLKSFYNQSLKNFKSILLSGFFCGISFLILQKAIFFIGLILGLLFWDFVKKRINFTDLFAWGGALILPNIFYLFYLILTESWADYWINNWLLNFSQKDFFSFWVYFRSSLKDNMIFWLLSLLGMIMVVGKSNKKILKVCFIALGLLGSVFVVRAPYQQYFLPGMVFLSMIASYGLCKALVILKKQKLLSHWFLWEIIFVCILFIVSVWTNFALINKKQRELRDNQQDRIKYILSNTDESDEVYDGNVEYNIFRKDIHYFWFSIETGSFETYNEIYPDRFKDYNVCELIKSRKSKFITDVGLDLEECDLEKYYQETAYGGIYELIKL